MNIVFTIASYTFDCITLLYQMRFLFPVHYRKWNAMMEWYVIQIELIMASLDNTTWS